jgi:hypothetical protein
LGVNSSGAPHVVADIAIPGVGPGVNFSFDLGDISGGRFFFTDRNNAAVDVIDIASQKLVAQIKGSGALAFAGAGARPALSGPDGINAVGNLLYVGDVNSVKIADPATNTIVKSITVSTGGVRADEGCLDSVHNVYMISSPEEATPFATFIDTRTQTILAKVTFSDAGGAPSAGLEQCRYDAASRGRHSGRMRDLRREPLHKRRSAGLPDVIRSLACGATGAALCVPVVLPRRCLGRTPRRGGARAIVRHLNKLKAPPIQTADAVVSLTCTLV